MTDVRQPDPLAEPPDWSLPSYPCQDRAGIVRRQHEADRDGVCYWCSARGLEPEARRSRRRRARARRQARGRGREGAQDMREMKRKQTQVDVTQGGRNLCAIALQGPLRFPPFGPYGSQASVRNPNESKRKSRGPYASGA